MSAVHLRAPTPEEFDGFASTIAKVTESGTYSNLSVNTVKAGLFVRHWLQDDNFYVRVAILEKKVIGFIVGHVHQPWFTDDKIASDIILFVAPGYRATGVGKMLAEGFASWAFQSGANTVLLAHSLDNEPDHAEKTYKSLGFQRVGPIYGKQK